MKPRLNKYTKEVEDTLSRLSLNHPKDAAEKLRAYLGTNLKVHGLNSKLQSEINKKGFSFYNQTPVDLFYTFDTIYQQSTTHEGKNQALIFLDRQYKHIPLTDQLHVLPGWVKQVDNWAHSDYLSKFLTRLTEHKDTQKPLLKIIHQWNKSKNHWERRQSLVSLYYYARTKKEHVNFDLSKKLILNLMDDKEYFVQKAVGWTLRESYNVYPDLTFELVEQYIKRISPVAFTTSIEKMTDKKKLHLKTKRK